MAKSMRKIIKIDEELCNGCGLCVPSCAEGAIKIIDGKARLVADKFCDGLGACMGECPQGALSFEEREAEDFDEEAAMKQMEQTAKPKPEKKHGGCPGSRMMDFRRDENEEDELPNNSMKMKSALRQWPVKLNLLSPAAPYLAGSELVLAADCSAFAYASFHPDFLKGKTLAIGCPKFDDIDRYIEKLTMIINESGIEKITVIHMEVPCCTGLLYAAQKAMEAADCPVPLDSIIVSIQGEIKPTPMYMR